MKSCKDDLVVEAIERASRAPFVGQQSAKVYVDPYIMRRFMNQSEIDAEEPRTFAGEFQRAGDVADSSACVDVGRNLDAEECHCQGEQVCIKCCTQKDLLGIHPSLVKRISIENRRTTVIAGRTFGEVFDIVVPFDVAEAIGWID